MLDEVEIPTTRAQFDEMFAAVENRHKRQGSEFLAVGRSNKLLRQAYLESKDGADCGIYRPKHEYI